MFTPNTTNFNLYLIYDHLEKLSRSYKILTIDQFKEEVEKHAKLYNECYGTSIASTIDGDDISVDLFNGLDNADNIPYIACRFAYNDPESKMDRVGFTFKRVSNHSKTFSDINMLYDVCEIIQQHVSTKCTLRELEHTAYKILDRIGKNHDAYPTPAHLNSLMDKYSIPYILVEYKDEDNISSFYFREVQ